MPPVTLLPNFKFLIFTPLADTIPMNFQSPSWQDPKYSFFELSGGHHQKYHRHLFELEADHPFRPWATGTLARENTVEEITQDLFRRLYNGWFAWKEGAEAPSLSSTGNPSKGWREKSHIIWRTSQAFDCVLKAPRTASALNLVDHRAAPLSRTSAQVFTDHLEKTGIYSRREKVGRMQTKRGHFICFMESAGDLQQPALHSHCRLLNFSNPTPGERYCSINGYQVENQMRHAQFLANRALMEGFCSQLGYEVVPASKQAPYTIADLDPDVISAFHIPGIAVNLVAAQIAERFQAVLDMSSTDLVPAIQYALCHRLHYPLLKARFDPASPELARVLLQELPGDLRENLLGVRDRAFQRSGIQDATSIAPVILPIAPYSEMPRPLDPEIDRLLGEGPETDMLLRKVVALQVELRSDRELLRREAAAYFAKEADGDYLVPHATLDDLAKQKNLSETEVVDLQAALTNEMEVWLDLPKLHPVGKPAHPAAPTAGDQAASSRVDSPAAKNDSVMDSSPQPAPAATASNPQPNDAATPALANWDVLRAHVTVFSPEDMAMVGETVRAGEALNWKEVLPEFDRSLITYEPLEGDAKLLFVEYPEPITAEWLSRLPPPDADPKAGFDYEPLLQAVQGNQRTTAEDCLRFVADIIRISKLTRTMPHQPAPAAGNAPDDATASTDPAAPAESAAPVPELISR